MQLPPAVILCHGPDAGLSAVRALSKRGVPVIAVLFDDNLAAHSRAPRQIVAVGGQSLEEKREVLLDLLLTMPLAERPVLLPSSDVLVDFLSDHRDALAGRFCLLQSDGEVAHILTDKSEETAWVERLGFALPKSVGRLPASAAELLDLLPAPIIIKLRKHEYWSVLNRKNVILRSAAAVEQFYRDFGASRHLLSAHELIEAPDTDSWIVTTVFDRAHRLVGKTVKQKIRMSPAHHGAASIAVSAPNPELAALVERYGEAMRLVGLAGFEFRRSPDGLYRYIEINPRFGGGSSGALYDDCIGVPNAWIAYRVALGLPPGEWSQKDGIFFADAVLDILTRRHHGESLPALFREHAALSLRHPVCRPVVSWRDPLPSLFLPGRWWARRKAQAALGIPAASEACTRTSRHGADSRA